MEGQQNELGNESQRIVTNDLPEIEKDISNVVSRGFVLSQMLLNIFISDFIDRIRNTHINFADATKL